MARREMSTDPRAVRTRATLIEATIELLKTNRAESLSVSQIVKAGNLSRQVFYEHFADRDALLYAAGEKILEPSSVRAVETVNASIEPDRLIEGLFETVNPYRDALRNLCDGPVHWRIHQYSVDKMLPFLEMELRENLERGGSELPDEHIRRTAELLACGVAAQLTDAIREGRSPKEARHVMRVVRETLSAVKYDKP
ncbi:TetR/AcrR family transcriptional regulator [Corynebacterium qintianiae]|uniref:TetR/AcrR family transcriptional regulator n=1 Tax=Corynebacterium qintianiae TaxID=2709392 RepID=A0A7T0KMP7_9CORY|nr:TetR/AcrR family transcriptional regulator [Corynebacterium qintianiae]QPK83309.1 TetR/AcrR family transcriptional regulator [Corynebacterium qintianiae]